MVPIWLLFSLGDGDIDCVVLLDDPLAIVNYTSPSVSTLGGATGIVLACWFVGVVGFAISWETVKNRITSEFGRLS